MTIYVDTGQGYPTGAELAGAGVAGVIGYVGTPGRRKNLTAPVVADYRQHGVAVLAVYEDITNDVAGGHSAGVAHAQATLADMRAVGLPDTTPVCAAADEHLTAGMIPTATAYQAGFYDTVKAAGWAGPVGGYGFAEFLAAIRAAGKTDWTWQAGTKPATGSWVNVWQRNGSDGQPTQMTIGGITVDIDDLLIPIPEVNMPLTPVDAALLLDTPIPRQGPGQTGSTSLREVIAWFDAAVVTNRNAAHADVSAEETALLAAVKAVPAATVTPAALAAAFGGAGLPAELAAQFLAVLTKVNSTPTGAPAGG